MICESLFFFVVQQLNSSLGRLTAEVSRPYTPSTTPLNEWSARRRGHYLHNKQQAQETKIRALGEIRPRDPSNRAASDLRLRSHGNRDRYGKLYKYLPYLYNPGGGKKMDASKINPYNAELNPICPLLALFGAHHILHVSRIRVK